MRRKQRNPQANVGPVEERHDFAAGPSSDGEGSLGLDLEVWEEEHASSSRPKKRQKRQRAAAPYDEAPPAVPLARSPQQWHFATVALQAIDPGEFHNLKRTDSVTLACATDGPRLELSAAGAAAAAACIRTPSQDESEALLALLHQGYLEVGPIIQAEQQQTDDGRPSSSAAAAAAGPPAYAAGLSLADKALADAASWPDDERQRKWQAQLLTVLRWALPHVGMDPEAAPPSQQAEAAGHPGLRAAGGQGGLPTSPRTPASPRRAKESAGQASFDAAELYAVVKPSGREPELAAALPELRPTLRRYQRRAAQWMVGRETGLDREGGGQEAALHPLWRAVPCGSGGGFADGANGGGASPQASGSFFYVNPFTGRVARERFPAPRPPKGAILSDEMGLGKTVELLACIVAHKYAGPAPVFPAAKRAAAGADGGDERQERIDCVCGTWDDSPDAELYEGLWVQCDQCAAWQHGACVGHPRRGPTGAFVCWTCQRATASAPVAQPCGTTLIVCPTPILAQWREEIARHLRPGALSVVVYAGQPQLWRGAAQGATAVTPADLAAADIVLTTYDVLRKDLHHEPDGALERPRRDRKRYEVLPTPLTRLRFWRVCLDEAQMVESSTAKAAEMAQKLQAVHRWAVTGTPLSRGLEDVQGLFAFLGVDPYSSRFWWARCIQRPYEGGNAAARARLLALLTPALGGLLWRSSKADVAHELGLPPQHQHLAKLELSAIERHFYARQHQDCLGAAHAALSASVLAAAQAAGAPPAARAAREGGSEPGTSAGDGGGGSGGRFEDRPLTEREERKLLQPLLRLRQACVHPQVGAGGIRALSHARDPMTLGEVLQVLLAKAKVEAEDEQRKLLAALNGLAGLLLLQGLRGEATRAYREALHVAERNAEYVRADALQQLHALTNLAEVLEESVRDAAVGRTLLDGELKERAAALSDEYVAEPAARLSAAEGEMAEAQAAVDKAREELTRVAGAATDGLLEGWWIDAVHLLVCYSPGGGNHVAQHIREQLGEADTYRFVTSRNASSLGARFRDLRGLQAVLTKELGDMRQAERAAIGGLRSLGEAVASPSAALVEQAASCERCVSWAQFSGRGRGGGRVCRHCTLDEAFLGWEVRLYSLVSAARGAGAQISAEEAARRAHLATLQRVGRGGLGEALGPAQVDPLAASSAAGGTRRDDVVARSSVVRHPSEAERALALLLQQLRQLRVPPGVKEQRDLLAAAAKAHLEQLEASRLRLFLKARALGLQQRHKLYSLDELRMCTMRMRLRAPGEVVAPSEELFIVDEAEVPVRSTELSAEKAVAAAGLASALGTLRYLKGIQAKEAAADGARCGGGAAGGAAAAEAEVCPVCQEPLGRELAMLPCGHRLCCRCTLALVDRQAGGTSSRGQQYISCPTCRMRTAVDEVSYIDEGRAAHAAHAGGALPALEAADGGAAAAAAAGGAVHEAAAGEEAAPWGAEEARTRVRGSYGTKVEAVVRRLLGITRCDPSARVLVFSSWKDALDLVHHALAAQPLPHLYPRTAAHFAAAVGHFRAGQAPPPPKAGSRAAAKRAGGCHFGEGADAPPRVLLLLVKQGGNGLNLQEAQHVVFVEPLLDPAEEAQAMGRVDRIGQTRATHVHRFVVDRSVEGNVHALGQRRAAAMDMSAAAVRRGGKAGGGSGMGGLTVADVAVLLKEGGGEERKWQQEREPGGAPVSSPAG